LTVPAMAQTDQIADEVYSICMKAAAATTTGALRASSERGCAERRAEDRKAAAKLAATIAESNRKAAARPDGWYFGGACSSPVPSFDPASLEKAMRDSGSLAWKNEYRKTDGTLASVVFVDTSGRVYHYWNGPRACDLGN